MPLTLEISTWGIQRLPQETCDWCHVADYHFYLDPSDWPPLTDSGYMSGYITPPVIHRILIFRVISNSEWFITTFTSLGFHGPKGIPGICVKHLLLSKICIWNMSYIWHIWASLMAQVVKNPPAMQETWVQSLGWEDHLAKGKATHSSILA